MAARLGRRRTLLVAGLLAGSLGLAAALIPAARDAALRLFTPGRPSAGDYARRRLPEINAALLAAPADFVLAAGDSHAELLSPTPLCGLPTLNGGSSGANTRVYARLAGGLVFARRPRAAVLTIGTNNMRAKNRPSDPATMRAIVAEAAAIIGTLAAAADRLVVTAVPPVGPRLAPLYDGAGIRTLSEELRRLCEARANCTFTDPFASLRSAESFAVGVPGALGDALHLADYPAAGRAIEAVLCPMGALAPSTSP